MKYRALEENNAVCVYDGNDNEVTKYTGHLVGSGRGEAGLVIEQGGVYFVFSHKRRQKVAGPISRVDWEKVKCKYFDYL
ncbi:MAG: hypothetical protein KBT68_05630 [bacterium]|nr:hypothetical protein [Candidatus Colisoma equi]